MEQKPKKPNNQKDNEPEIEELLEELRRQIEEQTGNSNFEIVQVPTPPATIGTRIISFLLGLIINCVLLVSLSGFIGWQEYDSLLSFGLFIIFFSVIEEILRMLIFRFVSNKVLALSFGSLTWFATIIAFIVSSLFTPGFRLSNVNAAIVLFFVFIIMRSTLKGVIARYQMRKRFDQVRKSRNNNK